MSLYGLVYTSKHLANDIELQFYDSSKPLYIEVDTSKQGIGAVMLQEDSIVRGTSKQNCDIPNNLQPIFYASKTLSPTESNYSNIECELLGVLFAVTHVEHFTYGHPVYVITDHKPLVSLFKKSCRCFSTFDKNVNAVVGLYTTCKVSAWGDDAPQ